MVVLGACDEWLVYRRGVNLLLLTATRRNELFGARASEIVDGLWPLPPERSKNGLPNYVALPWTLPRALASHSRNGGITSSWRGMMGYSTPGLAPCPRREGKGRRPRCVCAQDVGKIGLRASAAFLRLNRRRLLGPWCCSGAFRPFAQANPRAALPPLEIALEFARPVPGISARAGGRARPAGSPRPQEHRTPNGCHQ